MKKPHLNKILAIVLLISFTQAFALTCPPANELRNAKFIQANNLAQHYWLVTSEAFDHEGVSWNVWIEARFDAVTKQEEALKQAQKHLNEMVFNNSPVPMGAANAVMCMYNEHEPLFAISPPLYQPSSRLTTLLK